MNYRKPRVRKERPPGSKPLGRPSSYTPELAQAFCDLISGGMSLRKACQQPGMPDTSTIIAWDWGDAHPEFSRQYAQARETRGHLLAEESLEIADAAKTGGK